MRHGKTIARLVQAAIVASSLMLPGVAFADAPEVEKARQQFREGVTLMAAQDFAGALAKFKEVARVKMNAQVAFNTADCEEHLGMLVAALGDFRIAAAKASDGSAPDVASSVDARMAAVEKRIPHLTIERDEPKPNPTAVIQLDGVDVSAGQLGKPIAVDPGSRVLAVVVGGRTVKSETVKLDEGATKTIKLAIPPPKEAGGGNGGGVGDEPVVAPKGPSVPGIVVTSIGGASLVVGLVMVGLRQKAIGDLDELCGGDNTCPPSAQDTYDQGRTFTGVAEVTIPVGVAALTTGIILIAVSGKKAPVENKAAFEWTVVPSAPMADGPGLSVAGRF